MIATPALSSAPSTVVPSVVISVLPTKLVRNGKSLGSKLIPFNSIVLPS